ncbi:MAG: arginine deiminase family protein [Cytophagales bacterium]|nr:arginine deiminase family protein [Cytophagales bacterium]MDW8384630.1 arginine deiminase family protein [Flammeovirgaceae bacterium]
METTTLQTTKKPMTALEIHSSSEVGRLRRLMIHSPDGGLGKIIPIKAQEWLFEDIVHLDTMRRKEYDYYVKILLYFLDPEKIAGRIAEIDDPRNNRNFYKPTHPDYFNSDKVIDPQRLLIDILDDRDLRNRIVASVCAHERISYTTQEALYKLNSAQLATTLISGILPNKKIIFAPIPNYIFTRDIGITVNDHIILTKFAKEARSRENILTRYILFNHPYFANNRDKIIEITENEDYFLLEEDEQKNKRVSVEGGDVMTVAPNHLLIGVSERTTLHAVNKVIKALFERNVVEKISVIKIPPRRAYMHIDTTFTQVKRNVWVIFAPFSRGGKDITQQDIIPALGENFPSPYDLEILQFRKGNLTSPRRYEYLEDLLDEISQLDLKSRKPTEFIYSGDNVFPHASREQWTDSCNVLALKEGVVIGYDRNDKTADAFRKKGFDVIHAADLLDRFEKGLTTPEEVEDTLILLPSAELSRARGGSHCISMPLWRDAIV